MKRILLIEDSPQVRALVALILRSQRLHVDECGDGLAAIEHLARSAPYDLIVLDVMLPHVDGYQVLRSLRASERHRETPVMILSSRSADEDVARGRQAGAADYLRKPFEPDDLMSAVSGLLDPSMVS